MSYGNIDMVFAGVGGRTIYLESKTKETDLRKKLEELKNGVSLQAKN